MNAQASLFAFENRAPTRDDAAARHPPAAAVNLPAADPRTFLPP